MPTSYRPALDGVRTVAVYLVVLFHSGVGIAIGGYVGVDVFFVLSGYLITNVLLDDIQHVGRIRFGRFYSRRARRLLPAAIATVTATCVAFLLVASIIQRLPLVGDAQSALLYVANWRFLHEQNDYFATGVAKSPFLHFWSLAVEEQFYIVFPLVLLALTRLAKRRRWVLGGGLAALLGVSVALQLYWSGADPNHAYYGTDARAYQLLAGACLAFTTRFGRRLPFRAANAAGATGLLAIVLIATSAVRLGPSGRGFAATAASVVLLAGLVSTDRGVANHVLSHRPPVYLGRISYGTYLWHWPVILVLAELWRLTSVETAILAGGLATGLAAASYRFLELPIRRAPVLDRLRWAAVATGVSLCVVVAVVLVPPVMGSPSRPVVSSTDAAPPLPKVISVGRTAAPHTTRATGRDRVPTSLDWAALANDFGPERTCDAKAPQKCIVVKGSSKLHVLLVGDSHGRMLAPALIALAHEHNFTLALNVLPSCPWQANLTNLSQPPSARARCTAARDGWYRDVLPKLHPDVVVLATYARDDPRVYQGVLVRTGGSHESLHDLVLNTTNETLARITHAGARALIMKDTITSSFDPLDCLARSRYVDQCDVPIPRQHPVSDGFYTAAAAHSTSIFTFDVNSIVCPTPPVCAPMVDGINVWRNDNHYSTRILVHVRAQIWATLRRSGAFAGLL